MQSKRSTRLNRRPHVRLAVWLTAFSVVGVGAGATTFASDRAPRASPGNAGDARAAPAAAAAPAAPQYRVSVNELRISMQGPQGDQILAAATANTAKLEKCLDLVISSGPIYGPLIRAYASFDVSADDGIRAVVVGGLADPAKACLADMVASMRVGKIAKDAGGVTLSYSFLNSIPRVVQAAPTAPPVPKKEPDRSFLEEAGHQYMNYQRAQDRRRAEAQDRAAAQADADARRLADDRDAQARASVRTLVIPNFAGKFRLSHLGAQFNGRLEPMDVPPLFDPNAGLVETQNRMEAQGVLIRTSDVGDSGFSVLALFSMSSQTIDQTACFVHSTRRIERVVSVAPSAARAKPARGARWYLNAIHMGHSYYVATAARSQDEQASLSLDLENWSAKTGSRSSSSSRSWQVATAGLKPKPGAEVGTIYSPKAGNTLSNFDEGPAEPVTLEFRSIPEAD